MDLTTAMIETYFTYPRSSSYHDSLAVELYRRRLSEGHPPVLVCFCCPNIPFGIWGQLIQLGYVSALVKFETRDAPCHIDIQGQNVAGWSLCVSSPNVIL